MDYETILFEVDQLVATITLNRPDRMNAITRQMEDELLDAMQAAESSDDVRVEAANTLLAIIERVPIDKCSQLLPV